MQVVHSWWIHFEFWWVYDAGHGEFRISDTQLYLTFYDKHTQHFEASSCENNIFFTDNSFIYLI